jgi:hypothetical protein
MTFTSKLRPFGVDRKVTTVSLSQPPFPVGQRLWRVLPGWGLFVFVLSCVVRTGIAQREDATERILQCDLTLAGARPF